MRTHRTRRSLIPAVGALAAGLVLAGCSGSSSTATATTHAVPTTRAATSPSSPTVPTAPVPSGRGGGADWTTYNVDGARTGVDPSGLRYSLSSPAWTSPTLDGALFGQPLVDGGRVVVATEDDTVYALSATDGAVDWSTHLATPFDPSTVAGLCGNIRPTVGITSTPVIDPSRDEVFVVDDEAVGARSSAHHLVGLDLATGHVLLDEVIDPSGTLPPFELQRPTLALTDGRVVVGFGGNDGDCGDYHGYVVSAPEDGSPPAAFEVSSLPGDSQGAVWMGGGAPVVDAEGDVWVASGNGNFQSPGNSFDDSDAVLELSPTMALLQYFAPVHWYRDNALDLDFSLPPTLLPNGLVLAVGKSTTGYVLRQSHLGGVGGQLTATPLCFGHGPSAQVGTTVYLGCSTGIAAVRVDAPGATPTVLWRATNGGGGGVIVAGGLVWGIDKSGTVVGLDPSTGAVVQQTSVGPEATDFPSPSVGDGLLLVPSTDRVHAFTGTG